MVRTVAPHYRRVADEGRTPIPSALGSVADLEVSHKQHTAGVAQGIPVLRFVDLAPLAASEIVAAPTVSLEPQIPIPDHTSQIQFEPMHIVKRPWFPVRVKLVRPRFAEPSATSIS